MQYLLKAIHFKSFAAVYFSEQVFNWFLLDYSSIWLIKFIDNLTIWDNFEKMKIDITHYTKPYKKIVRNHSMTA